MELKLYSLDFKNTRTYAIAAAFIAANVMLPQLFHLIPQGGITWLPIYFFTLVAAYKYGWKAGLLTALLSPLVNSLLFGMPHMSALPAITIKSALLAGAAGYASARFHKASLLLLLGVVLSYQLAGSAFEWIIKGDFYLAVQDFRIGVPGMLLQIFGGWLIIIKVLR